MLFYDIECYRNFFYACFISSTTPKAYLDEYIEADKHNDVEAKAIALSKMDYRDFTIFSDLDDLSGDNDVCQITELVEYIDTPQHLLVGFNNNEYDDIMINYMIVNLNVLRHKSPIEITSELKRISDTIIDFKRVVFDMEPTLKFYKKQYQSWDVLNSLFETVQRKSLKQFLVMLKWHRIEDLPIVPSAIIKYHEVYLLKDYCINDVLGTKAILDEKAGEILMKHELSAEFGIYLVNSNRSKIADRLLSKFYSEATGLKWFEFKDLRTFRHKIRFGDIISDKIYFKDPKLQAFLERLKNKVISVKDKFKEEVFFDGNIYTFAKGGIHTKDKPGVFVSTDRYDLEDADVGSYYPWTIINDRICPAHLNEDIFLMIAEDVTVGRMIAKAEGKVIKAEGLKIVVNAGLFGKMGFEMGFLYDLKAMYATTINGELKLLMLAEWYTEIGCKIISANTDGLLAKVPHHLREEYQRVSKEWTDYFSYTLEFNKYTKYVRTSVNDYLAVKENGSVKTKGDFLIEYEKTFKVDFIDDNVLDDEEVVENEFDDVTIDGMFTGDLDLAKGYGMPVVVKAVNAYFTKGIDIVKFINEHTDIYDFCMAKKIGGQFQAEYHSIKDGRLHVEVLQKDVRFYASNTGGSLVKQYKIKEKKVSALAKQRVTVFNRWFPVNDFSEYNVDTRFYIKEAMKIIHSVSLVKTKDMKKYTGKMFDEIEDL